MENKVKKDAILLEVSGENGDIERYQRSLCEAALLGIDSAMFCCVWDDEDRGEKIFNRLIDTCKILNITPVPTTIGYEEEIFHQPMICKVDKDGNIMSLSLVQAVSFDEYKSSNGTILEEDSIAKVLAKL